ncbi:MAG: DUF389 domain-containing protein [Anaerolineales bacterium]|nr:DUF389 domain-containing protein [Anaerolineales bacterium]
MSLSDNPIPPEGASVEREPIRLPQPARRRRSRRYIIFPGDDERAELLGRLARRAFPSVEFFLFSFLGGTVLGAAYLLDAQSLLLLGALLAPLMTPWVGLALGTMTGNWRLFGLTLAGLLVGGLLVFVTGFTSGLAARIWMPLPLFQANIHSHLWWPNLFVLVVGAVLLVISFVRSEDKPILPSVMVTYELYLPLSAAAFGLGSGAERIWPDGLLVFLVHLALATLAGVITFAILHFRPYQASGYLLGIGVLLATLAVLVMLTGLASYLVYGPPPTATPTIIPLPSVTPLPEELTPSATPTRTPTSTSTLRPTLARTDTPPPQATPVYARIYSPTGGGALIRSEPGGGTVVQSLINDTLVEVLPETQEANNATWVHIRTAEGVEGWILLNVLITATPSP